MTCGRRRTGGTREDGTRNRGRSRTGRRYNGGSQRRRDDGRCGGRLGEEIAFESLAAVVGAVSRVSRVSRVSGMSRRVVWGRDGRRCRVSETSRSPSSGPVGLGRPNSTHAFLEGGGKGGTNGLVGMGVAVQLSRRDARRLVAQVNRPAEGLLGNSRVGVAGLVGHGLFARRGGVGWQVSMVDVGGGGPLSAVLLSTVGTEEDIQGGLMGGDRGLGEASAAASGQGLGIGGGRGEFLTGAGGGDGAWGIGRSSLCEKTGERQGRRSRRGMERGTGKGARGLVTSALGGRAAARLGGRGRGRDVLGVVLVAIASVVGLAVGGGLGIGDSALGRALLRGLRALATLRKVRADVWIGRSRVILRRVVLSRSRANCVRARPATAWRLLHMGACRLRHCVFVMERGWLGSAGTLGGCEKGGTVLVATPALRAARRMGEACDCGILKMGCGGSEGCRA